MFSLKKGTSVMCERCVEADKKLQRYRMLHNSVTDYLAVQMIREMIDTLAAEKNLLHRPTVGPALNYRLQSTRRDRPVRRSHS
jgi:hypothetical protein